MFRLSILSHLQVVTLGYFNMQLTLLLSTRSRLQPAYGLKRKAETCSCHLLNII